MCFDGIHLFRIFQEAVTNILRHSKADEFKVELKKTKLNLFMIISDNGVGIDESKITTTDSLGLLGMDERANQHGGSVVIENRDEGGAQLTVSIPITEIVQKAG